MTVTIAAGGTGSIPVAPVNALGLPPAIRLNPNFAEAFSNRGTALRCQEPARCLRMARHHHAIHD
jgi:hypothetical protein